MAMFLSDTVRVNQNTMLYAAAKARAPLIFGLVPVGVPYEEAIRSLDRADLLVYQEGGTDFTVYTNRNASKVLKALQDGHIAGWQFDPEPSVQLPDGGVVRFAKREIRSTEETLVPCSVLYQDGAWELTGYALHRRAEVLHVATRWKKLGHDDARYAIAAHLINADCSFCRNIDDAPIEGPGRFAALRNGESLIVSRAVPVAEWADRAEFWPSRCMIWMRNEAWTAMTFMLPRLARVPGCICRSQRSNRDPRRQRPRHENRVVRPIAQATGRNSGDMRSCLGANRSIWRIRSWLK